MGNAKLVVFLIFIFILFLHRIEGDGDFYHHINTGKYVLSHLKLPRVDEWTFTEYGKPWIAHSWAAGVLFYLIYTLFGVGGVSIFVASGGLITVFLAYLLMRIYHLKEKLIYPLLVILISLLLIRFPSRPEIFAYPFLISILLINKQGTKSPKLYSFYPLIIFLWSILYGANVFIGLGLLIFLSIVIPRERSDRGNLYLLVSVLLSILASLFNGYGFDTIFYILKIPQIWQIQGEWLGILSLLQKAPLDFLYLFKFRLAIYVMFLSLYLYLLITRLKVVRNHLGEFLMSLAIFLPFFTFRQVGLAAILCLPLLAAMLSFRGRLMRIFLWVLAGISISLTLFYNPPKLRFTEDPARLKLVSFISDNDLSGNAYTDQQIGSYISYQFYPKILVSYDTRDDLFMGGRFLKDSISGTPLELILKRYHADLIILDINETGQAVNNLLLSPNWVKLYHEDNFLVMKRK